MKNINYFFDGMKLLIAFIMMPIYKVFNRKKIYLIGERKDQCQDNGYHLFKYIRENHKDDKVYYCITKDSNQIDKIKDLGNIVYYKSLKHYLYYLVSEKLICAHVASCTPDTPFIWKAEEKNIIKKRRAFIQHGITKELIPSLMYSNTKFMEFICGAKPEYEYVKNKFGYPKEAVKYLGFCRFDKLNDFKIKNQILVMPTWRKWFGMDYDSAASKEIFINSEYFKVYSNLINNKNLNNILEEYNMKLIFYPHNEMQRYINLFKTDLNNIIIAEKEKYDVQKLLKESKILITDYSSIAFDFAYMRKDIIYYQFDEEKYFKNHYNKGYFDYKENGFGKVLSTENDLIEEIRNILNDKRDLYYFDRMKDFFELHDKSNCKRHYESIIGNDI